jgi:hypothetical protein
MKKKEQKKIILCVTLVFLIILLYYILTVPSEKPTDTGIEDEILTKFNLNKNETQIKILTNLDELKQKYPVIYGEAREGDYEIRTLDRLIIYDYGNDKIIKEFDVTQISIR